jgi:hypothetical protein
MAFYLDAARRSKLQLLEGNHAASVLSRGLDYQAPEGRRASAGL